MTACMYAKQSLSVQLVLADSSYVWHGLPRGSALTTCLHVYQRLQCFILIQVHTSEPTSSDEANFCLQPNRVSQHKSFSHVQKLLFNNFVCEAYGSGNASINGSTAEQTEYEAFVGTAAPTTTIYLEYTPITYVNLPVNLNPFTQFLVRCVNLPVTLVSSFIFLSDNLNPFTQFLVRWVPPPPPLR